MKRVLIFLTAAILCMMLAGAALADGYPMFDFDRKAVTLNSGYEMPILGLGMFSLSDSEAENSTYWALKAGFRLLDVYSDTNGSGYLMEHGAPCYWATLAEKEKT